MLMLSSATRDSDTGKGRMGTWPLIELLSLLGELYLLRKVATELIRDSFITYSYEMSNIAARFR